MDLKALGLTREELIEAVASKAYRALNADRDDYDEDGDSILQSALERATTRLRQEREKAFVSALDAAVAKVCADVTSDAMQRYLETLTFTETSGYGEPKKPSRTLKEQIDYTIGQWMNADVDRNGLSKAEKDHYEWRAEGKRIPVMIHKYIREDVETAVKGALAALSATISGGLGKLVQDVVKEKLATVQIAFKN